MIDLTYNNLANGLHVALGALFVFIPVAMGLHYGRWYGTLAGVAYGLTKEFWFDLIYEDDQTSGGIEGGCRDFAGYFIGILLSHIILWL